jgi:hypothetical protein
MSNAPQWFKFYPSQFFSDIAGMDSVGVKDYIIGISRAWVNCDFDNMTSSQIEQYHTMMESNNNRSEKLKAIWELRTKANSGLIDVHRITHSGLIDNDRQTIDPNIMLSNLKESKKKKTIVYALESVQYNIALNMDSFQKDAHGDGWRSRTPAQLQGWADAIDKMHRIDKIPYSMIWGWYCACFADGFWKDNVISPDTLRKQLANNKLIRLKEDAEEYAHHPYDEVSDES